MKNVSCHMVGEALSALSAISAISAGLKMYTLTNLLSL